MKKYIFLTPGITNMGGSEMYTYNKWRYLSTHGWDVNIFYFNTAGTFLLNELSRYKDNCIPDLRYGVSFFTRKQQEQILNRLIVNVNAGDEVVVESHVYNLTLWGELIAAKIGAKHILKCMEENIEQINVREAAFVEYKLKRNEVLNSTPKSLNRYFGKLYKDSYRQYSHGPMGSYCSNVVTHKISYNLQIDKKDYNILSIGRLEKDYVLPTLTQVKCFVEQHPEHTFNLIVIGGDPKGRGQNNISNIFKGVHNISLYFTGYMYPIPSNLITINDVAIASSNSVLVPSNEGVPTIAIDVHDNLPIGIYGRTTNNKFLREKESPVSVVDLLEDVLINEKYPKTEPIYYNEDAELEAVFGKQVDFLSLSPGDGNAYAVNELYSPVKRVYDRTKKILHNIGL